MKKNNSARYLAACMLVLVSLNMVGTGCKKLAEVEAPVTSTSTENAYKDKATASAVFVGLYARLSSKFFDGGLQSLSVYGDLSADNLTIFDLNSSRSFARFYQNNLEPRYVDVGSTYWKSTYELLYTINDAIERLKDNKDLQSSVSQRLLGEAYFLRAFCYFYLTNLYGDVPLVLSTDPDVNSKIARSSSSAVYDQMVSDLLNAETLLTNTYVGADVTVNTSERLRPNLAAVQALLARVYLYKKDYPAAESNATKVISQTAEYSLTSLNNTFVKNSPETIWSLQSVTLGLNTFEGRFFVLPESGPDGSDYNFYASGSFVDSFEPGDQRHTDWVGLVEKDGTPYHFFNKYKIPVVAGSDDIKEYEIVLRLSEQYLIRAEARNEQGNSAGAIADVNAIRTRSRAAATDIVNNPLPNLPTTLSQAQIRTRILAERRMELFGEWGHRWFDLKRSGTIDNVMITEAVKKGGVWSNYKALHPIPTSDIFLNKSLTQNPGYIN